MKTLTQTSIEQGAIQPKQFQDFGTFNSKSILFHDEAQLLATFNAWSAQQGWKIVPIEPTQDMCQQGQWKANEWKQFPLRITSIYKAMLDAAPIKG